MLGLCCYKKAFSSLDNWASHFSDSSYCRAWALGHKLQQLWCMGLVVPQHVESPLARNWTHVPCTGRKILNHWTIRETLQIIFYCFYFHRNLLFKVAILRSHARRRAMLRTEDLLIELLNFQTWIYYLIFPISKSLIWEHSLRFLLNPAWEPLVKICLQDHRESPINSYGVGSVMSNTLPRVNFSGPSWFYMIMLISEKIIH